VYPLAVLGVVVGPVGEQLVRAPAWPVRAGRAPVVPRRATAGAGSRRCGGRRSARLTAGYRHPRSRCDASSPDGRGAPGSDRFWAAPGSTSMGGVDNRPRPVQVARPVQLGQQQLVQPLPDPGPVPLLQAPPAGQARPKPQLLGQELLLDPVYSTNKISHNTCRSGIRFRPGSAGHVLGVNNVSGAKRLSTVTGACATP
jgi:hypothetical protein